MKLRLVTFEYAVALMVVGCGGDASSVDPTVVSASSVESAASTGAGGSAGAPPQGGSGGSSGCMQVAGEDSDHDGFAAPEDCDDCNAAVNPGAIEIADDSIDADEDCNGMSGEMPATCDAGIFYAETDPMKAAQAIDLCAVATPNQSDHGVLQARWVRANGMSAGPPSQLAFGMQQNFGPNVPARRGVNMLVLSSGHARLPGQQGAALGASAETTGDANVQPPPLGFPQATPNCQSSTTILDDIGLELMLRAPSNATGFRYLFKFYSFEFAEYVCTQFNDQYVALLMPPPAGAMNGNISFDMLGTPVSVNSEHMDVCDPTIYDFATYCAQNCPSMPSPYCPLGVTDLVGSGFDDAFGTNTEDAGATSWLETIAPVEPGEELAIRFAIWDATDKSYDSTVLIDGFEWLTTPGVQLVTQPAP